MDSAKPNAATPLLLITGFLGSGKTTFINRLLTMPQRIPQRLGVVVNEFGQVGIDGSLLLGAAGSGILELANGCVCCIRGTEMWEAALDLVDRAGAEVLLIETSGLVEPHVLLEQYRLLPAAIASRIDLRGLLCVVDVVHVRESVAQRPEAAAQLRLSNRLLLTKLDLATSAQLLSTHSLLDEMSASTERVSLTLGAAESEVASVLSWALSGPFPPVARPMKSNAEAAPAYANGAAGHHHGNRQIMAVSLYEPEPLLAAPLMQLLRELRGEVLRVKGIVRVLGAPWDTDSLETPSLAVLHLAGRQVELQPLHGANVAGSPDALPGPMQSGSTLVFLGEALDESWLRLRLSACRSPSTSPIPTAHGAPSVSTQERSPQ